MLMIFVKAQLPLDVKSDEYKTGHADRQSNDIDHGIRAVFYDASYRGFKIIFKHNFTPKWIYSYLNDFTGFAVAARIVCQLIVSSAINSAAAPASKNDQIEISIR